MHISPNYQHYGHLPTRIPTFPCKQKAPRLNRGEIAGKARSSMRTQERFVAPATGMLWGGISLEKMGIPFWRKWVDYGGCQQPN